jgi:hypothetical protein
MSAADTARATYASSRAEILERIRLRDSALLGYFGGAGTILGFAANGHDTVLLVLPYLSLAATLLVCQHDWTVATLCTFIADELRAFWESKEECAPSWEFSATLSGYSFVAIRLRSATHFVLITCPAIFALVWVKRTHVEQGTLFHTAWYLGIVSLAIAVAAILVTHFERFRNYKVTRWLNWTSQSPSTPQP